MRKPLYLHTEKLTLATKQKIENAGFVCVKVESFDTIKIVSDEDLKPQERMLLECALEVLTNGFCYATDTNIRHAFNRLVANRLVEGVKKCKLR